MCVFRDRSIKMKYLPRTTKEEEDDDDDDKVD